MPSPSPPTRPPRRRTWPSIIAVFVAFYVLMLFPPVHAHVQALDVALARLMNGWLGHSRMFDLSIGALNSKAGDRLVVAGILLLLALHVLVGRDRPARARRMAFWIWTILLFTVIYQGQRMVEDGFTRDSPGKVLEPWFDLRDAYGIKAKTTNTNSYPSGHGTAYYFFAFMALRHYRRMGLLLLVMAAVLPTTRIVTGAHWPSDLFLGSLPLALLFSALAHEPSLRHWLRRLTVWCDALLRMLNGRRRRTLRRRLAAAWTEFTADRSPLRDADRRADSLHSDSEA